ncbi:MAG: hypothetical protein AAGD43_26215 [Pseudomonadota bacterium]
MSDWQPIETAPKNRPGQINGPRIRIRTKHHGHEFVICARYCAGVHNRWLDVDPESSVSAKEGDGSEWQPIMEE